MRTRAAPNPGPIPWLAGLAAAVLISMPAPAQRALPRAEGAQAAGLRIDAVEPDFAGIGSLIRIRGAGFGGPGATVVRFAGSAPAAAPEFHTAGEIRVRVPLGAESGPVTVITGIEAGSHAARSPGELRIVPAIIDPPRHRGVLEDGGVRFLASRLVVDLDPFAGLPAALDAAAAAGGALAGFVGPSNTWVIDLVAPARTPAGLYALLDLVRARPAVVAASPDLVLETKQGPVAHADPDMVDRYRQHWAWTVRGRTDVWATDRIQAPAAWNLLRRFVPAPAPVKVAVVDTGCDQNHPEFAGVALTKVVPPPGGFTGYWLAAPGTRLPPLQEAPYDLGDPHGHGTSVTSIIGAANGAVLNGNAQGDRGMCGLLSGHPLPCTVQVHGIGVEGEPGGLWLATQLLAAINTAAITGARALNASLGQTRPISPIDPDPVSPNDPQDHVRVTLRKLARQLVTFQDQLLFCVAAGNEGGDPLSWNLGEVTPFEDLDLDGALDPGEDLDGDGILGSGNYVVASLGTLPNVLTVGAIGGSQQSQFGDRDDERASFSNFGTRRPGGGAVGGADLGTDLVVHIAAPGVQVFCASPGGPVAIGAGGFDRLSGTSFATPHVTGSAGILFSIDPALSPAGVRQILIGSALPAATTIPGGANVTWNTLKTGAAVRKLLLQRGTIANGTPWSGLGKAYLVGEWATPFLPGIYEMRQNPTTRRSELFGPSRTLTGLSSSGGAVAAFSPTGRRLSWLTALSPTTLGVEELDFVTDQRQIITTGPAGGSIRGIGDYIGTFDPARPEAVVTGWISYPQAPGGCPPLPGGARGELRRDDVVVAQSAPAPSGISAEWIFSIHAHPDNHDLHLGRRLTRTPWSVNASGGCTAGTSTTTYRHQVFPWPVGGGVANIPDPAVADRFLLPWQVQYSGDGRAFVQLEVADGFVFPSVLAPAPRFHAFRGGPAGAAMWQKDAPAHPELAVGFMFLPGYACRWSPDGSEVALQGVHHLRDGSDAGTLFATNVVQVLGLIAWTW